MSRIQSWTLPGFLSILLSGLVSGCASDPYYRYEGPIGTVIESSGIPAVTRNNQPYFLAGQSQVYVGDIITTDEKSAVVIKLVAGQTIGIAPLSQWLIIDVTTDGVNYQSDSSLSQGALDVSGRHSTPHQFTIRTSLANLTTFAQNFWLGYAKGTDTELIVASNDKAPLVVSNTDGITTLDSPLQTTTVSPSAAPKPMTTWSDQKLKNTIDYYKQRL